MDPEGIVIVGADGTEHVFPAGFDPKRAAAIVRGDAQEPFAPPTVFKQLLPESIGQPVEDAIEGAGRSLVRSGVQGADLLRRGWNAVAPDALEVDRPALDPYVQQMTQGPDTTAGRIGSYVETAAELAPAIRAIPGVLSMAKRGAAGVTEAAARGLGMSKSRAGETLRAVEQAVGPVRVTDASGKIAEVSARAKELQQAGATMPRAAQRLAQRVTDPNLQNALTFRQANDFASNLSRLSARDATSLTPAMQRQIIALRNAVRDAATNTASAVGQGDAYTAGIREYARAAQAARVAENAKKVALPAAASAAGATWLYRLMGN